MKTKKSFEKNNKPLLIHFATVARSFFYFSQLGQIQYMKEHGFEVIVAARPDEMLNQFSLTAEVNSIGIKMKRAITPSQDLFAIWQAWHEFRRLKPQIVHAHTPKGGLVGMLGAFLAGVKVRLYHLHGLPHLTATGLTRIFLMLAEKVSCKLAHRVYFVSNSIRDIAIEKGLCHSSKAKVLCNGSINGVDAQTRFNPKNHDRETILEALNIPKHSQVIGFVGRVVNDKGIRELIQSWIELREKFRDLHFIVVGPMEEKDAIPTLVKNIILEDDRIRYIGEVEDTSPFYSVMDVLAFPTYREGFGLVAIEAGAMEVSVVSTKIPGCVDAVVDNVTGTLIPPSDSFALKNTIEQYLSDPDLRLKHGANGRQRALTEFRPEDIWAAQYDDYMDLLHSMETT